MSLDYKNAMIPNTHWVKLGLTSEDVQILLDEENIEDKGIVFLRSIDISDPDAWHSTLRIYFKQKLEDSNWIFYHFCVEAYMEEEGYRVKHPYPGTMNILPITTKGDKLKLEVTKKDLHSIINEKPVDNWPNISNPAIVDIPYNDMSQYREVKVYFTLTLDKDYYFIVNCEVREWEDRDSDKYIYKMYEGTLMQLDGPYVAASLSTLESLKKENLALKEELAGLKNTLEFVKKESLAGIKEVLIDRLDLTEPTKIYGFIGGEPAYVMTLNPGEKVYKRAK